MLHHLQPRPHHWTPSPLRRYCGTTVPLDRLPAPFAAPTRVVTEHPCHRAAFQCSDPRGFCLPSSQPARSKGRRGDLRAVEQMLTAATERILAALQAHDLQAMRNTQAVWRVDMRQQVLAQRPRCDGISAGLTGLARGDFAPPAPRAASGLMVCCVLLRPFQYPRISGWSMELGIGSCGWMRRGIGSPPRDGPCQGFYYFVGPPSVEDAATAAYQEALRMAKGTAHEVSVKDAAVQYQVTPASARENEAHMHRTAAASAEVLHQMAALSKANRRPARQRRPLRNRTSIRGRPSG